MVMRYYPVRAGIYRPPVTGLSVAGEIFIALEPRRTRVECLCIFSGSLCTPDVLVVVQIVTTFYQDKVLLLMKISDISLGNVNDPDAFTYFYLQFSFGTSSIKRPQRNDETFKSFSE